MVGDLGTPPWVANVREEIGRSPAWEVLSDQIYERVSTLLKSHGLGHFSDLSPAEQTTLLEEAHREISCEDNKVYQAFESQFSKSMDAEIAKEARARVDRDQVAKRDGADEALYLDRILDSAAEGAVSLLSELPREHLGSLRLMLNQPIPSLARLGIWRLLLKHTEVREEYELLMKQNRNSTISGQDIYITHRCQALLESGRIASSGLLPLTSRNVVLMKTVLSYHHACLMTKRGEKTTAKIPESFVHFLVPLCAVVTRGATHSSSFSASHTSGAAATAAPHLKIESQIEGLVEMFEGALEAGLEGLVDPEELDGSGGDAKSSAATRSKKTPRTPKSARGVESPKSEGGAGASGGNSAAKATPAWVDKVHGMLVPGFQELVDHVARVHLGLALTPPASLSPQEGAPDHEKKDGGGGHDNNDAYAEKTSPPGGEAELSGAAEGKVRAGENDKQQKQQQQSNQRLEGESDAKPQSPRRVGRRAALSRRREGSSSAANANKSSAGDITPSPRREGRRAALARRREGSSSAANANSKSVGDITATSPDDSAGGSAVPLASVSESQARVALLALLKSLVTVGLVGYLGADACLFAWDQAVIGGFGVMLPRVAAMVLAAAADKIRACSTFALMSKALLSHAHTVSTSQLQDLMETHCMPSVRQEMRVSHKLAPEIVGPTLKTATEILDSTYSKRTRETQQARKAHVEHVLGPSKRASLHRINDKERLRLDLRRTTTRGSSQSSIGGSSVDLHDDDSSGDGDDTDGDDGGGGCGGRSKRGRPVSNRRRMGREGSGGGEDRKKNESAAVKKKTWREKLSQRRDSGKGVGGAQHAKDGKQGAEGISKTPTAGTTKPKTAGSANKSRKEVATVDKASTKAVGKTQTKVVSKTAAAERRERSPSADSTDASVALDHGGDGRHRHPQHRTSKRRQSAGAAARSPEDSAASSSMQESTGRKPQTSSEYSSQESYSSRSRDSERRGRKEANEREGSMKHSSDRDGGGSGHGGAHRSWPSRASITDSSISAGWRTGRTHNTNSDGGDDTSGGGRGGSGEEKAKQKGRSKAKKTSSSTDVGEKTIPPQADTSKKERSRTRRSPSKSREEDGVEGSKEKSAKSTLTAREAKQGKGKTGGKGMDKKSAGGEALAAGPSAKPMAAAPATTSSKSPLRRLMGGFGRRKNSSSPLSPAKGTKVAKRPAKSTTDLSSWMND